MIKECLDKTVLFDFIEITLNRHRPESLDLKKREREQKSLYQRFDGWSYDIQIKINALKNPQTLYIDGASVPAITKKEYHNSYLEIVQVCRNLLWLPKTELFPAMVETIDTKKWLNLNPIRDAIISWRFCRGI